MHGITPFQTHLGECKMKRSMPTTLHIMCLISPICFASLIRRVMITWDLVCPAETLAVESTSCSPDHFLPLALWALHGQPSIPGLTNSLSHRSLLSLLRPSDVSSPCFPDFRCCFSLLFTWDRLLGFPNLYLPIEHHQLNTCKFHSFPGYVHTNVTLSEHHKYQMSAIQSGPSTLVHCNVLWAQVTDDTKCSRKKFTLENSLFHVL